MAISVEWDAFRSMVEWQVQRSHRYWEPFLIGIIDTDLLFQEHLPVAVHETLRGCDLLCRTSDDKVFAAYPDKLSRDQISVVARIMAAVDIFDALTSDRPYRKGMSVEVACTILREGANSGKLDDSIVEHLIEVVHTGNGEK